MTLCEKGPLETLADDAKSDLFTFVQMSSRNHLRGIVDEEAYLRNLIDFTRQRRSGAGG